MLKCRLCEGRFFSTILDLGDIYMSDFVKSQENLVKFPMRLVECKFCKLLQLAETASMEKMYQEKYWYKSGINPVIVDDLKEIAAIAKRYLKADDILLDIGANDGTLTSQFENPTVGCEPARNFHEELSKRCTYMIPDFWRKELYTWKKAKVITAIGMFYDTDNPNQFVRDMKDVLADDGVIIAQLMTLSPMVDNNDVGNICHEHLEYYSYNNLLDLFETNGLEIFAVEENGINGGSYRLFARKFKKGSVIVVEDKFDGDEFARRVKKNKTDTVDFVRKTKNVYGYGASTKGNTILQYYGLDNKDIIGISDKNPEKLGLRTPGTDIPVVSEEEAREKAEWFFILPWGFTDYFITKERKLGYRGGFIVCTPKFKIYEPLS